MLTHIHKLACSCHGPSREWRPPAAISSRPVLRRPASFSGYADPSGMTGSADSWALRGSVRMSSMRRTSIPSFATLHEVNVDDVHLNLLDESAAPESLGPTSVDDIDLAALPPPPDFLLDSLIIEATSSATTTEENHSTTSTTPPAAKCISVGSSLSVAAAVKSLNEIRHQPASPNVIRRAQSMRVTPSSDVDQLLKHVHQQHQLQQQQQQQQQQQMMMMAVAKGGPGTMPKIRRNADALHHHKTLPRHLPSHPHSRISDDMDMGSDGSAGSDPESASQQKVVSGLLSKSSFVNQLNAKLAQQQQIDGSATAAASAAAAGMRMSPARISDRLDHESLMDQIRRGTSLRRARSTNDRSRPKI